MTRHPVIDVGTTKWVSQDDEHMDLELLEDDENPENRVYMLNFSDSCSSVTIGINGNQIEDLSAWWENEKRRIFNA